MQQAIPRSIVIVEDEPAHAEAMRRALRTALPDVNVRVAATLGRYRELIGEQTPLLAMVDMNLPDGRAVDVLTSPAESAAFPVVVMTSFGDQKMAVDCLQAGAIDYFAKSEQSFLASPGIVERALRQWMLLQERKHAQELLRTSEERHRALFENAHDAIFLLQDGRFTACNPITCRLFRVAAENIAGESPWRYSPEFQPDRALSAVKAREMMKAALTGGPQVFEWLHERADGTQFTVEVSLSRLQLQEHVLLQGIVHDVTERRQFAEELAEKNRQLQRALGIRDRFLAMISHELRTPLNGIIGLSGILAMKLDGPLTQGQDRHLKGVRSSALHLLAIINDLLDLSRLESGRIEPRFERVSPLEVVEEVTAAVRPMAAEKGLALELCAGKNPTPIRTDRRLLKQILFNLVSNGVKYTDAGSVSVSLCRDGSGSCFRVADTGPGIPAEHRHILFSEFGRIGTDPSKDGTGLGLYLSQKLAGLIGGRITFESAMGEGSVFTLALDGPETEAAGLRAEAS